LTAREKISDHVPIKDCKKTVSGRKAENKRRIKEHDNLLNIIYEEVNSIESLYADGEFILNSSILNILHLRNMSNCSI
jgi:hypothetical protein